LVPTSVNTPSRTATASATLSVRSTVSTFAPSTTRSADRPPTSWPAGGGLGVWPMAAGRPLEISTAAASAAHLTGRLRRSARGRSLAGNIPDRSGRAGPDNIERLTPLTALLLVASSTAATPTILVSRQLLAAEHLALGD